MEDYGCISRIKLMNYLTYILYCIRYFLLLTKDEEVEDKDSAVWWIGCIITFFIIILGSCAFYHINNIIDYDWK